jgi:hypothetical protein
LSGVFLEVVAAVAGSLAQLSDPDPACLTITQPGSLGRIGVRHVGECVHPDVLQVAGK